MMIIPGEIFISVFEASKQKEQNDEVECEQVCWTGKEVVSHYLCIVLNKVAVFNVLFLQIL